MYGPIMPVIKDIGRKDTITARVAVISGGLAREPVATEAAYRAAGTRVLHTGRVGAVRVVIDPGAIECHLNFSDSQRGRK